MTCKFPKSLKSILLIICCFAGLSSPLEAHANLSDKFNSKGNAIKSAQKTCLEIANNSALYQAKLNGMIYTHFLAVGGNNNVTFLRTGIQGDDRYIHKDGLVGCDLYDFLGKREVLEPVWYPLGEDFVVKGVTYNMRYFQDSRNGKFFMVLYIQTPRHAEAGKVMRCESWLLDHFEYPHHDDYEQNCVLQ